MKNPLEKDDHSGLIVGLALGVTAGISLSWLYLTEQGCYYRGQTGRKFKDILSDAAAAAIDANLYSEKSGQSNADAVIED